MRREVADGKAGVEDRRVGPAHRVGIDHRIAELGGSQERLNRIAATDLAQHQRVEPPSDMLFHHHDRLHGHRRLGGAFEIDDRRAPLREHANHGVVIEFAGLDQRHARAVGIERLQGQQTVIGIAATAGSQDPGAGRQELQFLGQQHSSVGHRLSSTHEQVI